MKENKEKYSETIEPKENSAPADGSELSEEDLEAVTGGTCTKQSKNSKILCKYS